MLGIISDMMSSATFFDRGGKNSYSKFDDARRQRRMTDEEQIRAERRRENPLLGMPSPFLDLAPRGKR